MRILLAVFLLAVGAKTARAEGYCALTVKVVDPKGREVPDATITVEQNGRVLEKEYKRGGATFCDLSIFPVTVKVGDPECAGVTVQKFPLEWGEEKTLHVVYDWTACMKERVHLPFCEIVLRFIDETGKWIPEVSLSPPRPTQPKLRSDDYGRFPLLVELGQLFKATARGNGFVEEPVELVCNRDLLRAEKVIKLRSR
jgi:hypothetical protein